MASKEVRAALRKQFSPDQVYQRQGPGGKKLDYISGETMIERLIEATSEEDTGYAWIAGIHTLEKLEKGWLAVVQGQLQIQGDIGTGTGAMVNPDPDMAVKSANTEALKNAAKNGFGVGLELWNAEYREKLGQRRRASSGNEAALKSLVFDLAKGVLGDSNPGAKDVAKAFDVSVGDLSDPDVLREILVREGLL